MKKNNYYSAQNSQERTYLFKMNIDKKKKFELQKIQILYYIAVKKVLNFQIKKFF